MMSALDSLKEKPRAFTYIFALVFIQSPPQYNKEDPKQYVEECHTYLQRVWVFCEDLFRGIKELEKNIIQHSGKGCGMVTVRIYDKQRQAAVAKDENFSKLNGFRKTLTEEQPKEYSSILDINVFDLGNIGIIPSLIEFTTKELQKPNNEASDTLFQQDLEKLTLPKPLGLLLDSGGKNRLNQQQKRTIAHLGLMFLSKLVQKNSGQLVATSKNTNDRRDSFTTKENYNVPLPSIGTAYNIMMPFSDSRPFNPHRPTISSPLEEDTDSITASEGLVNATIATFQMEEVTGGQSGRPSYKVTRAQETTEETERDHGARCNRPRKFTRKNKEVYSS